MAELRFELRDSIRGGRSTRIPDHQNWKNVGNLPGWAAGFVQSPSTAGDDIRTKNILKTTRNWGTQSNWCSRVTVHNSFLSGQAWVWVPTLQRGQLQSLVHPPRSMGPTSENSSQGIRSQKKHDMPKKTIAASQFASQSASQLLELGQNWDFAVFILYRKRKKKTGQDAMRPAVAGPGVP